jgi:hypothetical protein
LELKPFLFIKVGQNILIGETLSSKDAIIRGKLSVGNSRKSLVEVLSKNYYIIIRNRWYVNV